VREATVQVIICHQYVDPSPAQQKAMTDGVEGKEGKSTAGKRQSYGTRIVHRSAAAKDP